MKIVSAILVLMLAAGCGRHDDGMDGYSNGVKYVESQRK